MFLSNLKPEMAPSVHCLMAFVLQKHFSFHRFFMSGNIKSKKIVRRRLKEQQFDKASLFPIISLLVKKFESHQLTEAEFVAAYIISFLHKTYPKCLWLTGALSRPIQITSHVYPAVTSSLPCTSINQNLTVNKPFIQQLNENEEGRNLLWNVIDEPGFFSESDKGKIQSRFVKVNKKPTLLNVFQYFSLRNIPFFVNECIVNWGAGKRPAKLLFYMPTAEEILKLQCEGKRCVTAFVTKEGLTATYKDPYPPFEEKDALRFLLHDIQHMEKFVDPKFYCEQVGFLNDMKKLFDANNPQVVDFSRYTKQFLEDVDHVISDMNACCIHLFAFFKAKWKIAQFQYLRQKQGTILPTIPIINQNQQSNRSANVYMLGEDGDDSQGLNKLNIYFTEEESSEFDKEFKQLLLSWNLPEAVIDAAMELCQETPLSVHAAEIIRKHYHKVGENLLGIHFDLTS